MTMHELRAQPELSVSGEREVGAIVADMWENGEKLARQEIALGLAELQVRSDKLKKSLQDGAIVGAFYNAGGLALLAAVVLALSELIAPWLAASLVGVAAIAGGYALQKRVAQRTDVDVKTAGAPQSVRAMKEGWP